MGNTLSQLEGKKPLLSDNFLKCKTYLVPVSVLRNFKNQFCNLSSDFGITKQEFTQIIPDEAVFDLFDTEAGGVVQVTEILAGLVMFSEISPDDKVQCNRYAVLFNLFDFNSQETISRTDLQLLCYTALSSVSKVLGHSEEVDTSEVCQVVANYFHSNILIDFSSLLEFCLHSQSVTQLLTVVESTFN